MSKKLLVCLFIFLLVAAGIVFIYKGREPSVTQPESLVVLGVEGETVVAEEGGIIRMIKEGFQPATLAIKNGETVTWINQDNRDRWPASDIHPIHSIYPEFDPLEPISPGESWSFTFLRVGTWGFHDHLDADKFGEIEVVE